jgi:hypothetical protein
MAKMAKEEQFGPDEAYPVTEQAPAQDDQQAAVVGDAGHEDSPVRTARPDVPIAAVMAGGVGRHRRRTRRSSTATAARSATSRSPTTRTSPARTSVRPALNRETR